MESASLAELERRGVELLGQLGQADEFLALDASNPDFLNLKKVVLEALMLNDQQISALRASGGKEGDINRGDDHSDDNDDGDDDGGRSGISGRSRDVLDAFLSRGHDGGSFQMGDNVLVEGLSDGSARIFAAYIIEIDNSNINSNSSSNSSSSDGTEHKDCKVKYFEFPDAEPVQISKAILKPIPPGFFALSEVQAGQQVMCKYAVDGQYYEANVLEKTKQGVAVVYTKYGNKEVVPVEYIRPPSNSNNNNSNSNSSSSINNKKGLIHIPDKLKILPTDTEEEKKRKKIKLKGLKNHNRIVTKEIELDNQKASWQSFAKSSKAVLINKSSIFSTSRDQASSGPSK